MTICITCGEPLEENEVCTSCIGEDELKWVPMGLYNEVLDGKDFYISYAECTDAGKETAIVLKDSYAILAGDFRKEYEKVFRKGVDACLEVYNKYKDRCMSKWDTYSDKDEQ